MSILLEALRKSEKNQHAREAPTIHSDDQTATVSESLRTGPLALLLIAALFLIGWFIWRQYQPPAGSYQPPVTLEVDGTQAVSGPVENKKQSDQSATPIPGASDNAVRSRTPVESYQAPQSNEAASTAVAQEPAKPQAPSQVQEAPADGPVSSEQRAAADSPASLPQIAADNEPLEVVTERYNPGEPEPLGYWDLPDAVRADVPEIKFSVLVYATDPAQRFVLINGQRLTEGDSVKPGLVVEEIQRDGVLFSYRLYRFLVKR